MSNNPKTKNNEPAPDETVIAQFRRYQGVLVDTAQAIPRLLAEQRDLRASLGKAEISGGDSQRLRERAATIDSALQSGARQRSAASESLLSMSNQLRAARADAEASLAEIAQSVVADFSVRWARAVAELSRLHAESAALGAILHRAVPTPVPYMATANVATGAPQVVFAGHHMDLTPSLPVEVQALSEKIAELDAAIGICASVAQSKEMDARHTALQRTRTGMPTMTGATYTVVKPFGHLGSTFPVGSLIDDAVMGPGSLYRHWLARELQPLEDALAA